MEQVHALLAQQRAKIASLEGELERERSVLLGMEQLSALLTPAVKHAALATLKVGVPARSHSSGPGRQVGAISHEWRAVLAALAPSPFTDADFHAYAQANAGRDVRVADAKRRRERYSEIGLVEDAGDGFRYRVSDHAIQKFGLLSAETNNGAGTPSPENPAPLSVHSSQGGPDADS